MILLYKRIDYSIKCIANDFTLKYIVNNFNIDFYNKWFDYGNVLQMLLL